MTIGVMPVIVSFNRSIDDAELDQFLSDIKRVIPDSGRVQTFSARRHIPVPGEDAVPALIATVRPSSEAK